jgi:molybdopterin synthase catalytic subunit
MHVEIRIQTDDFCAASEYAALRVRCGGVLGAVASFVGLVRDRASDRAISALHLEHYPGMTESSIRAIVDDAATRWPLLDVLVVHRVGTLPPDDQIVLVQVGSSHRAAAFGACALIMDYLKTDAVFWKRENSPAGDRWVEATGDDRERVSAWRGDAPES